MRNLLAVKSLHFLVTRFGPSRLRSLAFDEKYRNGEWCFRGDNTGELPGVVARYLRKGDLLVVGCGGASILEALDESSFNSVLGIDLSTEAIRLASRLASANVRFEVGDVETFESLESYDEILFSESIYYLRARRQLPLLSKLGERLKPGGAFVVTLADPVRYRDLIERIRAHFHMLEDRPMAGSRRHLLVFQPQRP